MKYQFVTADVIQNVETYLKKFIDEIVETDHQRKQYKFDLTYHKERIQTCILWIYELTREQDVNKILVVGDDTIIEWCLTDLGYLNKDQLYFTNCELRGPFPYSNETFDLVVNLEVLEHLKDTNESTRDLFTFSGAYNLIGESSRVLKPGKKLFLTTPNAVSLKSICRMFLKKHPYMFYHHVREYTPLDIVDLFYKCNLELERLETLDIWDTFEGEISNFEYEQHVMWKENKAVMEKMLNESNFDKSERGDDIFAIGRRKN